MQGFTTESSISRLKTYVQQELYRLDLAHHLCTKLMANQLFHAPIEIKNHRILDVGTGTGVWAIDMGKRPWIHL